MTARRLHPKGMSAQRWSCLAAALVISLFVLWSPDSANGQRPHRCAADAVGQARKLLAFHYSGSATIDIGPAVTTLAPIRNPANGAQRFDVLEVWGFILKGQYRMRFFYAQLPGDCVLMGQEILEFASL